MPVHGEREPPRRPGQPFDHEADPAHQPLEPPLVGGRPLRWVDIGPDELRRRIEPVMPPGIADVYLARLATSAPATGVVEAVTGRPGRTFARWAADHVADFR